MAKNTDALSSAVSSTYSTATTSAPTVSTALPPVASTLGTVATNITEKGDKNQLQGGVKLELYKQYRELFPKNKNAGNTRVGGDMSI
jgi:hypothetical protein